MGQERFGAPLKPLMTVARRTTHVHAGPSLTGAGPDLSKMSISMVPS
jgi:hypothetical protein